MASISRKTSCLKPLYLLAPTEFDGLKLDIVTPDVFVPSGIGKTTTDAFFDIVDAVVMFAGPGETVELLRKTANAIEEESIE